MWFSPIQIGQNPTLFPHFNSFPQLLGIFRLFLVNVKNSTMNSVFESSICSLVGAFYPSFRPIVFRLDFIDGRNRRREQGACVRCGSPNHWVKDCTTKAHKESKELWNQELLARLETKRVEDFEGLADWLIDWFFFFFWVVIRFSHVFLFCFFMFLLWLKSALRAMPFWSRGWCRGLVSHVVTAWSRMGAATYHTWWQWPYLQIAVIR